MSFGLQKNWFRPRYFSLATYRHYQPERWPDDVDELAALYDDELNSILDHILQYDRHTRPSDPWFDKECRDAKRLTRRLERAYTAVCRRSARGSTTPSDSDPSASVASAKASWYNQRPKYRQLHCQKCTDFWHDMIDADWCNPRRLWHSVDVLCSAWLWSHASELCYQHRVL